MPREKINYPVLIDRSETPNSNVLGGSWNDPAIHVSWQPESVGGHVQLAFEGDREYFQYAVDSPSESDQRTSVYSPVLQRQELNKLIRVLRRARDQAYGRDE